MYDIEHGLSSGLDPEQDQIVSEPDKDVFTQCHISSTT